MLEWTLNTNVARLPETSTPCRNILEYDPGVILIHPTSEFEGRVNRPYIKLPQTLLEGVQCKPLLLRIEKGG
jgi:hypothetical protein